MDGVGSAGGGVGGGGAGGGSEGSGGGAGGGEMGVHQELHVRTISLRRRADRWAACAAHLSAVLPAEIEFRVCAGTDAAAAIAGAPTGEAAVAAFEQSTGSRIYRGWPLVEVTDARRCFPSTPDDVTDAAAWLAYECACRRAWRSDRARLYVDFYHRHLTAGDVGAALSHLRVAEEAHAEGLPLTLVLEDDARLTPKAIPLLLCEIVQLKTLGVCWDLIYLHTADYGRRPEPAVHPSSRLRVAGHRKVCHAYVLSSRGAAKLATSGFRECLFPVDDFLPALHAGHPREDIMMLPCVRRARGDAAAVGEEASGAAPGAGFVALTFEDDAGLLECPALAASAGGPLHPRAMLDSDSKAGTGSSVLLGDAGVATSEEEEGGDEGTGGRVGVRAGDASCGAAPEPSAAADAAPWAGLKPPIELCTLGASEQGASCQPGASSVGLGLASGAAEELRRQLSARGYARLRLPPAEGGAHSQLPYVQLLLAEAAATSFFRLPREAKRRCAGPGGRKGDLLLWSCGYSAWPQRQHWHLVCGAFDEAQPWPAHPGDASAAAGAAVTATGAGADDEPRGLRPALRGAKAVLRGAVLACLGEALNDGGVLLATCRAVSSGEDPSVLDAFLYAPASALVGGAAAADAAAGEGATVHMSEHTDPGVLTITRRSDEPGLEVWDASARCWEALEQEAATSDLLVFAVRKNINI